MGLVWPKPGLLVSVYKRRVHNRIDPRMPGNLLKLMSLFVDLIKLFWGVNLLTLSCKPDLFIAMQQILLMFIKWSGLQKCVGKFMPK